MVSVVKLHPQSAGAALEPLVELYQHKGASECLFTALDPLGSEDELCGFELLSTAATPFCHDMPGIGFLGGCVEADDFARGALRNGLGLPKRRLVEPDLSAPGFALHPQIDGAIAARELLLDKSARPDLKSLEARGQTEPQIERTPVYAARFPVPARIPVHAVGAGEASHALERHPVESPARLHSNLRRLISRVARQGQLARGPSERDSAVVSGPSRRLKSRAGRDSCG